MLIFPHGLYQRKHEYLLAVQIEVEIPGKDEPDKLLNVLNSHNEPLRVLPSKRDFVIEGVVQKLQKSLAKQNAKLVAVNCVDLGPVKSELNWENKRKYVDHGRA